jgi:hypothetical protein
MQAVKHDLAPCLPVFRQKFEQPWSTLYRAMSMPVGYDFEHAAGHSDLGQPEELLSDLCLEGRSDIVEGNHQKFGWG